MQDPRLFITYDEILDRLSNIVGIRKVIKKPDYWEFKGQTLEKNWSTERVYPAEVTYWFVRRVGGVEYQLLEVQVNRRLKLRWRVFTLHNLSELQGEERGWD